MGKKVGGGVQEGGNLMPIHVDVWQKPSQYCKLLILKLKIKYKKRIIEKKEKSLQKLKIEIKPIL